LHIAQFGFPQLNNGCLDFGRRIMRHKKLVNINVFDLLNISFDMVHVFFYTLIHMYFCHIIV